MRFFRNEMEGCAKMVAEDAKNRLEMKAAVAAFAERYNSMCRGVPEYDAMVKLAGWEEKEEV